MTESEMKPSMLFSRASGTVVCGYLMQIRDVLSIKSKEGGRCTIRLKPINVASLHTSALYTVSYLAMRPMNLIKALI